MNEDNVRKLIEEVRKLTKFGLPNTGGQPICLYTQGRQEAELRVRQEARRILREYEADFEKPMPIPLHELRIYDMEEDDNE